MADPEITQTLEVREVLYNPDGSRRADKLVFELSEDQAARYIQAHARHPGVFPEFEMTAPKPFELRLRGQLIDTADTPEDALARIDLHQALWQDVPAQPLDAWTVTDRNKDTARSADAVRDGVAWPPDGAALHDFFAAAAAGPPTEPPSAAVAAEEPVQ